MKIGAEGSPFNQRTVGAGLVLAAAIAWSFAGLLASLVSTDAFTATSVRAAAAAIFLAVLLFARNGTTVTSVIARSARAAPGAILLGAASMVLLMFAYFSTQVANVVVIYATAPFWSALLCWMLFGERTDRRTLIASGIAFAGVIIVAYGALVRGNLLGDLLALAMTMTFIGAAIALRRAADADSTSVTFLACVACGLLTLPFADFQTLTLADIGWLALLGILTSGFAYLCFMAGSRLISTTEAGLISAVEVPLGILWPLLVLDDVPAIATIAGGTLITVTVVWHLAGRRRQE